MKPTAAVASWSRFNSYWGTHPTERYLGCKQNLGHPVNDLFDLRTAAQPEHMKFEPVAVRGPVPVEMGVSPRDRMPPRAIEP